MGEDSAEACPLHVIGLPPEPRLLPQLLAQHWMPLVAALSRWLNVSALGEALENTRERLQLALLLRCPRGLRHSILQRLERRLGLQAAFVRHRTIHQEKQLAKTLAFTQHLRH